MIKKLKLIPILVLAISLLGLSQPASAHFIIEDSNTGVKALFHVTPDHDPIAGKESIISFDFSDTDVQIDDYTYVLTVKSTKAEAVTVPTETTGNVILAGYAFPSQGFYDIKLTATHKADNSVSNLHYGQRVSRGVEATEQTKALGPLEIGAIAGVVLIATGAIIFSVINDRNDRKEKKNEKGNRK